LLAVVYTELRRIARNQMRREREGHTLQPMALVHEAFLRLVDQDATLWQNRAQFFGVAAQVIRRLLVDHARRRRAAKRAIPITLDEALLQPGAAAVPNEEILAVDQALNRLARLDARFLVQPEGGPIKSLRASGRGRRGHRPAGACFVLQPDDPHKEARSPPSADTKPINSCQAEAFSFCFSC
jgi:hypothetical protein